MLKGPNKFRDSDGTVIAKYYSTEEPDQPADWEGD